MDILFQYPIGSASACVADYFPNGCYLSLNNYNYGHIL